MRDVYSCFVCRTNLLLISSLFITDMLIDFSDVLETNVFVLGDTYLKFLRVLKLKLPIVDPSLYIHRFAAKLEFGDKTQQVALSALRLVARMKRDWMQVGRRPSGICGAGLLIAARLHGFKRTQKEIVHIVKICDVTLRKRYAILHSTEIHWLTFSFSVSVCLNSRTRRQASSPHKSLIQLIWNTKPTRLLSPKRVVV